VSATMYRTDLPSLRVEEAAKNKSGKNNTCGNTPRTPKHETGRIREEGSKKVFEPKNAALEKEVPLSKSAGHVIQVKTRKR